MRYAIIDTNNLFFRARHAVGGDAFTKAGMALHIVFRSLRRMWKDMNVDHMVFVTEGGSWRYKIYPIYKAKRKIARAEMSAKDREEEEIFIETLNDFITFISEKTRCTVLHQPGVEGDDFVARWIQLHPDDEHIVLSGDSDFVQLLAPNVTIMDGVQERIITMYGVKDFKGNDMEFNVCPSSGKIKVPGTIDEMRKKHDKAEREKKKADKSYIPAPYTFEIEPEWWRKALFIKLIRGDDGDGIFSAYPGVRYKGSSKKVGIREAWNDRHERGYDWNNFFLQRWAKMDGQNPDGTPKMKDVRVLDEFKLNESLIDLTMQPDDVKALMDEAIVQAVQKEPVGNVGIHFLKFCEKHSLPRLRAEAADHSAYLMAAYTKR